MMTGGIMFDQRDIVLIPFPYTDLTGAKLRPALIISNENINKNSDRICCLITSNPTNEGLEIKKLNFQEGKLPFKSWIKPHRIFTIDSRIVNKRLCSINVQFYERVFNLINNNLCNLKN